MLSRSKIDDWIKQVESMPVIAPIIIRQITSRLLELDEMNETLRAENLELSSGSRVKEFEHKIAELEFQIDLLQRQVGGEAQHQASGHANLVLYNEQGQVMRLALDAAAGDILGAVDARSIANLRNFGLVAANPNDELLFVFSSGRTSNLKADSLPLAAGGGMPPDGSPLAWQDEISEEMNSQEELVAVLPITRMTLYSFCVQVSRFGYAKKIAVNFFKGFVTNNNVGRGAKFNFDRMLGLVLGNPDQAFVVASRQGNLLALAHSELPVATEEIMKFKVGDYLVSALMLAEGQNMAALTRDGELSLHKATAVLPVPPAAKRAKALLTAPAGDEDAPNLAGVVALNEGERCAAFWDTGALTVFDPARLTGKSRSVAPTPGARALALAAFTPPQAEA